MSASEAEKKVEEEVVKGGSGELSEENHRGSQLSESESYLVGFVTTNIVGLKHYSATITGNEILGLVREPLNPSDSNAIKVLNTQSLQVGYIERPVAAVLSPLIDAQIIAVEGLVRSSPRLISNFRIPIQVHVFANFSSFGIVHDAFNQSHVHFIAYTDPSFTLSHSIAVKETRADNINGNINTTDTTTNPNFNAKNLDEVFKLVHENLIAKKHVHEVLSPPNGIIKSALLQHQKEGLAWLFQRENSGELPPFWEEREGNFVNMLTHYQTRTRPEPLRGGIFADGMGLGKTLTFLSLIAYDKMQRKCGGKRRRGMLESKGTLVVCPPSVISTWIAQLEEHSCRGALKTYMYYGDKRTEDFEELGKYDLVLTTYATLGIELTWPDSPMKMLEWWRIVLDEAHTIRNVNAGQSKAVIALKGKRRWAVTGTPIQNGSYDLFSLMAFLHFEPFSIKGYWQSLVQRPLNQGEPIGLTRLQALMAAISLRRTKDIALVGLPPKTVETCYVELSCEERKLYDKVIEETRSLLVHYDNHANLVHSYSTILSMVLRLRQICTDSSMCPKDLKSCRLSSSDIEDVSKNPELLQTLVRMLQDGEDFECPICISPPTDIVITFCAHIFCRECILKTLQRSNSRCPLCRHSLSESDLFSAPPASSKIDTTESTSETRLSTKASTLIKLLTESRDQNLTSKSVVFSQFRKMLLLLEEPLKAAGFETLRLDGSMNAKYRARVIEQFQLSKTDKPMVLLASLRTSSTGINLTAASRVYLMEPWWNLAVEEQAMDRVHRIGQKEAVKIVRLIARNSIEEKILILQEKKNESLSKGFGRGSKDLAGVGIEELRFVLGE